MKKIRLFPFLVILLFCLTLLQANAASDNATPAVGDLPQNASKPDTQKNRSDDNTTQDKNQEDGNEEGESEGDEERGIKLNAAWDVIWSGQREMINEIRDTALTLSSKFSTQTKNLSEELRPYEQDGRRLLVFITTFHNRPNAMEAVNRRLGFIIQSLNNVLAPINEAREEAEGLLDRINQMTQNLPTDEDKNNISPEMREYMEDITRTRFRMMAVIAQYDSILPSLSLVQRLESTRKEISEELPQLWKDYYLQKPVPWLNPEIWIDTLKEISYAWQAIMLRLPVEVPITTSQWSTAILRFFIVMLFGGIVTLILRRRWLLHEDTRTSRHMFSVSIPAYIFGLAFLGSAISATGEFFRVFLAIGSLCIIMGQIYLGWDLRCMQYPDEEQRRAPFLSLVPLAFSAFAILYLPLTTPLALVLWTGMLIIALCKPLKKIDFSTSNLQLESGVLDSYAPVVWICLFISLCGFQIYSMALYLAFVALSVALELSLGGMNLISVINEHLPQEGTRAVLARLGVAVAAPFVLIIAVIGLSPWVLMVPGGTYLLAGYAFKGITIGATQFNIIQVLLIFSVFYLTRTVVSMGTRFLAKLPQKGINFDATLITPLQTALTYSAWAIFGLFVLRSLGMQLSNLAMVAGGLSVGIGFGMQTIVNNFLSGLILIFGRTMQVGDMVDVGGIIGRVRKISVRATMVETPNNAMIYVPNSEFMSQKLINWTSFTRSVRREVEVGVAYGSDTDLVIKLLISIAKEHENVLKYPQPSVIFSDFAASSLNFTLRFWVRDYDVGAVTSSEIRLAINRVFNENNIEIAFPQLDVHLKDAPPQEHPAVCAPTAGKTSPLKTRTAIIKGMTKTSAPNNSGQRRTGRLMRIKNRETGSNSTIISQKDTPEREQQTS